MGNTVNMTVIFELDQAIVKVISIPKNEGAAQGI